MRFWGRTRIDPAVPAAALGLTVMESRVAVLVAEVRSVREVAAATGLDRRVQKLRMTQSGHRFADQRLQRSHMKMNTLAPPGANLCPRLERNDKGRDFVVGDVHGHFATLRQALAELEVGEHDRVFSLGDLVDRGPHSFAAKDWIAGPDPSSRFALVLPGNHEQMMLEALLEGPPRGRHIWDETAWSLWDMNGGGWWDTRKPDHSARPWINVLPD